jgi:microcystin-dependent protein
MADQFVAEIRIFPFNFAPTGWALCNGQLMPISQNTALFSLLGTTYGGDGKSTFALPDLQDRTPMHPGFGPGLTPRELGETGGEETVTLLETEIPAHTHGLRGVNTVGESATPSGMGLGRSTGMYQTNSTQNLVAMADAALPGAGGSLPHENRQPFLVFNFCIALQGIFPPRG